MGQASTTRASRRFVLAGLVFLLAWQAALLADGGHRLGVALGLYGFVLHTAFGKAYALVPSYFDRSLADTRWPAIHLPLAVLGTLCLATAAAGVGPTLPDLVTTARLDRAGSLLWAGGVALFLGTLALTLRDNLTGAETGTSDAKEHLRPTDRLANAAMPIALGYVGLGSALGAARSLGGSVPLSAAPQVSHLLAAGGAALLVFAVGFRLLPRFLVATPSRPLVGAVLATGSLGPALLAAGIARGGPLFSAGAALQAVAVAGFAVGYLAMFVRSDRRRVGLTTVALAVVAGLVGVALGVRFALAGRTAPLVAMHYRANLLGFLGLTIVGVSLQFYPPSVGRLPGASDRTAAIGVSLLAAGLAAQLVGLGVARQVIVTAGESGTLLGAAVHAYLVVGAVRRGS